MTSPETTAYKYSKLTELLRNRILSLPSGAHLPSVRALMKRYNLSMQTVNMALKQLESENLISIKHRSGIFVSSDRYVRLIVYHRARHPSTLVDAKEESLRRAFDAIGWQLLVCRYEENPLGKDIFVEPKACAHVVNADMVDDKYPFLPQILRQGVPVVALAREPGTFSMDYLTSDEPEMMMTLTEHLRSRGHQRVGFLVNEPCFFEVRERLSLFQNSLEKLGMPPGTIVDCETKPFEKSNVQAYAGLSRYLERTPEIPFTALIVSSSAGGPAALRAFHERGYRVPDDCSVATFGDEPQEPNIYSVPSITGIDVPMDAWGDVLVNLLQQRFVGDESPCIGRRVPSRLIARESTAAPPGNAVRAKKEARGLRGRS